MAAEEQAAKMEAVWGARGERWGLWGEDKTLQTLSETTSTRKGKQRRAAFTFRSFLRLRAPCQLPPSCAA